MQEYCLGRAETSVIDVYDVLYSSSIDVQSFIELWDKLATELNYPTPELMSLEDRLLDLIAINNYRHWFDLSGLDMFDDEYEILEQFNVKYSDIAIENKIELSTIEDILNFIVAIRQLLLTD